MSPDFDAEKPCTYCLFHVFEDHLPSVSGFTETKDWVESMTTHKILALDCEMSYTDEGLELTRVSVVDHNLKHVYDEVVKPESRIRDYNTEFRFASRLISGITENHIIDCQKTIKDVHQDLKTIISNKTILIGHSIEHDLKALKVFI
ncbi:RNA exonuclease 1 [Thelohanellus kitauei]|uniref:RNA exonuclease 1 n=1 Tax=Thelohanellus kitauei TaxID=669202 RepID=A0A0C2MPX0_THEKT|nr:RNA exonuclease 1 [Thelohanellus kitauei]